MKEHQMTQLFELFERLLGYRTKENDLEQFINSHSPKTHGDVESLSRDYLYYYISYRGL
jgi:hypothetical protein